MRVVIISKVTPVIKQYPTKDAFNSPEKICIGYKKLNIIIYFQIPCKAQCNATKIASYNKRKGSIISNPEKNPLKVP